MATRFEIVLHGDNPHSLRAAGEEAVDEISRIESQLSLYRPDSEVARLNREAHQRAVRITPALFRLLEQARDLSQETGGAFDITIAPLVRCWGFMGAAGSMPEPSAVEEARASVGMHLIELDSANLTVRFVREGVMLDFGAIGKGYAIDRAVDLLREAGITRALIHGGTSTAYALGRQPDDSPWKIAVTSPENNSSTDPLAIVELESESLSVSAVWGRSFKAGEKTYGHIIDLRTGAPSDNALLSAMVLPSATETDALSTALLAAPELMSQFAHCRPAIRCLVVRAEGVTPRITAHGLSVAKVFETPTERP